MVFCRNLRNPDPKENVWILRKAQGNPKEEELGAETPAPETSGTGE